MFLVVSSMQSAFHINLFDADIKFQRCSSKLSFLFLPHCPSAPESLLAGYNMLHRWLTKEVDKIELFLTILCLTDTALQFS